MFSVLRNDKCAVQGRVMCFLYYGMINIANQDNVLALLQNDKYTMQNRTVR